MAREQTETERVASELLLTAIAFERFGSDMTSRVMEHFRAMERDLVAVMVDIDYQAPRSKAERDERLAALMDAAEDIVEDTYREITDEMTDDLRTVAETSEGSAVNALFLAFGAAFLVGKLRAVPVERLHDVADGVRFDGATVSEWLSQQQADTFFRFKRAVMDGGSNDLTIAEIIETLTGSREAQRRDGAFQTPRRNVETLIFTAVQVVATAARLALYEMSDGLVPAVGHLSILDSKTSQICMAYSGKRWRLPDYDPIGHNLPFGNATPRHFRCRSQTIPVFDLRETATGTQSSESGQVPAQWTYEDWLRSRSEEDQRDILGPTKYDLWKRGKLSFSDLVDQRGNPLTVAELTKRFSRRQAD